MVCRIFESSASIGALKKTKNNDGYRDDIGRYEQQTVLLLKSGLRKSTVLNVKSNDNDKAEFCKIFAQ